MKDNAMIARPSRWRMALAAIAPVVVAAVVGSLATAPNIPTYYANLAKPGFTPPNWVFGPAWTLLYAMIAIAFWRVLMVAGPRADKRAAILVFLLQLVFNALWSVVFFGMHMPGAALVVVAALWLSIVATIAVFAPLDRPAAWLLAPYLAWVTFAAALNAGVWLLNR